MAKANPALAVDLLFVFFFSLLCLCAAQTLIPSKYDGFVYGKPTRSWKDSVVVEAFYDPMCPYSRDSWPPLKKALRHYSPRVSVIVHPFPLPYHSNSYTSCRALHIANKLNSSSTFPLLELFFKHQEKYYNAPTYKLSRAHIIDHLSKLAASAVGKNSHSAILSGFKDRQTDATARASFRYGCSRGVVGTPTFFVNGIQLSDDGSTVDFKKWRSIIDPLLAKQ